MNIPLNLSPTTSDLVPSYDKPVAFDGQVIRAPSSKRVVHRDYKTGVSTLETVEDFGCQFINSSQSEIDFTIKQSMSIHPQDPLSAKNDLRLSVDMGRDGWRTAIDAHYVMTCDAKYFYIQAHWKACCDDDVIFERSFDETIKRNYM